MCQILCNILHNKGGVCKKGLLCNKSLEVKPYHLDLVKAKHQHACMVHAWLLFLRQRSESREPNPHTSPNRLAIQNQNWSPKMSPWINGNCPWISGSSVFEKNMHKTNSSARHVLALRAPRCPSLTHLSISQTNHTPTTPSSLGRSLLPLWYLPALTKFHRPLFING